MTTDLLREYESVYITPAEIPDDRIEAVNKRIKDTLEANGGKLLRWHTWGKRKLAYEINRHTKGAYFHLLFLGSPTIVKELERNMRMLEDIIRYMTVLVDEDVDPNARPAENDETPVLVAKEEPGRHRERRRDDRRGRRDEFGDDGDDGEGGDMGDDLDDNGDDGEVRA